MAKIELLDSKLESMGKDYECLRTDSFEAVISEYSDCNIIINRYSLVLIAMSSNYIKITRV